VFFACHDPTELNRQGPDVASSTLAIFTADPMLQKLARHVHRASSTRPGSFRKPIAPWVESSDRFFPSRGYHTKTLVKAAKSTAS